MDEFGVLVESIGFKAQGRSAPLAKLKSQPKQQRQQQPDFQNGFSSNTSSGVVQSNPPNNDHFFVDDLDGIFRSRNSHDIFGGDDVFGVSFPDSNKSGGVGIDLDAVFGGNSSSRGSTTTTLFDDFLGTIPKDADLFGLNSSKSTHNLEKNGSGFDDLIPGFGPSITSTNHGSPPVNSGAPSVDNFFEEFVSGGKDKSAIDDLEEFAKGGRPQSNANEKLDVKISKEAMSRVQEKMRNMKDIGKKQNANIKVSLPEKDIRKSRVTPMTKVEKTSSSPPTSHSTKKEHSSSNYFDDFSFFGEPAPSAVEFENIDGEPEERRIARLKTHIKTKERMAKALDDKNQRDLQAQREQEEKSRLSETLDDDIKRWAAGKEGNLRALLSSLQHVLWPECEWKPVSLTDLITSISVKKVYLKATLYVHPDKVQQKGAKQKYIAERVFDVLKEAWNKFSAEELR